MFDRLETNQGFIVTTPVKILSLSKNSNVQLSDIFITECANGPVDCRLTDTDFIVCTQDDAVSKTENQPSCAFESLNDTAELVVFNHLTLAQLSAIVESANVTLVSMTECRQIVNATSIRFNVYCEDFNVSQQAINAWCIDNQIEAGLVTRAPSLSAPGLLLMDMDSTTIQIECIDEIAKLAGVGEQVAEVTELAMQGKLDFSQSLIQRVGTLAGQNQNILSQVLDELPLMPGLTKLVEELKQRGWRVAIASGGFTYFADHLKDTLDLDAAVANELEIKEGTLTGKVLGNIVDAQVKADTLLKLQSEFGISDQQTIAMGDGANDLVMMKAAAFGVAYKAKPIVSKQADVAIHHTGLDTLLHWLKA